MAILSWDEAVSSLEPPLGSNFSHCDDHSVCQSLAAKKGSCSCEHWLIFCMSFDPDDDEVISHISFDDCMEFIRALLLGIKYDYRVYKPLDGVYSLNFIFHFNEVEDTRKAELRLTTALDDLKKTYGSNEPVVDSSLGSLVADIDLMDNVELFLGYGLYYIAYSCCMEYILTCFLYKDFAGSSSGDLIEEILGCELRSIVRQHFTK